MIETDGVSCSIILIRKDKKGKKVKNPKAKKQPEDIELEISDEDQNLIQGGVADDTTPAGNTVIIDRHPVVVID